ncbi:MAG: YkgJ family cysteine cluster protein [Desulfobulbaceae bacterium]|nr:YkgJ family cysteine cluster protein [Desulfobulbaceae bacterium]
MEKEIFQCRRCGHCCHGETTVSLTEEDLARMVDHLRLPREEVIKKYLRVTGKVVQMQVVDGHCIFYHQGCSIHLARPWRCRQWPLHPSILTDQANFSAIKDSCPGIRLSDYSEFERRLRTLLEKAQRTHRR